jgi:hypothetical protein
MSFMSGLNRRRGLLSVLSGLAGVVFLAGFAACLVCDLETCCEDTEHGDEDICACACAFHSIPVVAAPLLSQFDIRGAGVPDRVPDPDAAPPGNLFHPPRA